MKTWIKRSLIGLAVVGTLFGGVAVWAHNHYRAGWHALSEQDGARMKEHLVKRVGKRLDLDAVQKAKLGTLADKLREQRNALVGSSTDPRTEVTGLIAGPTFDRAKAGSLIDTKVAALTGKSPEVVAALADFYDSLKPEQQAQVRQFVARGGHRGRHGQGG